MEAGEQEVGQADMQRLLLATQQVMTQFSQSMTESQQAMDLSGLVDSYRDEFKGLHSGREMERLALEFEAGMQEASRERRQLVRELESECQERSQINSLMEDCIAKLQRLEQRVRAKRKREAQAKRKTESQKEEKAKDKLVQNKNQKTQNTYGEGESESEEKESKASGNQPLAKEG